MVIHHPYPPGYLGQLLLDFEACGRNQSELARRRGKARCTIQTQLQAAFRRQGAQPPNPPAPLPASPTQTAAEAPQAAGAEPAPEASVDAEAEVRALRAELASLKKDSLTQDYIRRKIMKLAADPAPPPRWLVEPPSGAVESPGVPTLFASDWHWAEVVDPSQIGGVNAYDLQIAHTRARTLISSAIRRLRHDFANPVYPGIVFALGGDMMSGTIHEELLATNEVDLMPAVLDLFGVLKWCIETLANEFGAVFVPSVSGNHGRDTHKIRMKGRGFTSFDWLLAQFLEKHFENDPRVSFLVPNGPDALYRIYHHRYLLSHGDAFRGGDGMVGALGPIIRGDHRKRGRQSQVGAPYDTLMIGHWHQYVALTRLIVNGSLKGYDEFASASNFGFELPQQALWLTHPKDGITFSIPIVCSERNLHETLPWVSWLDASIQ